MHHVKSESLSSFKCLLKTYFTVLVNACLPLFCIYLFILSVSVGVYLSYSYRISFYNLFLLQRCFIVKALCNLVKFNATIQIKLLLFIIC